MSFITTVTNSLCSPPELGSNTSSSRLLNKINSIPSKTVTSSPLFNSFSSSRYVTYVAIVYGLCFLSKLIRRYEEVNDLNNLLVLTRSSSLHSHCHSSCSNDSGVVRDLLSLRFLVRSSKTSSPVVCASLVNLGPWYARSPFSYLPFLNKIFFQLDCLSYPLLQATRGRASASIDFDSLTQAFASISHPLSFEATNQPDSDLDAQSSQPLLLLLYAILVYQTMSSASCSSHNTSLTTYFQLLMRKYIAQFKSFQRHYSNTLRTSSEQSTQQQIGQQRWSNFDLLTDLIFVVVSEYSDRELLPSQRACSSWRSSTLFVSLQKNLRSLSRCAVKMLTLSKEDGGEDWDLEACQPDRLLEGFMTFLLTYAVSWRRLVGELTSPPDNLHEIQSTRSALSPPSPHRLPFHIIDTFKYAKEVHEMNRRVDAVLGAGVRALVGAQKEVLLSKKLESMAFIDLEMMLSESIGIHLPVWCEVSCVSDSEPWLETDKGQQQQWPEDCNNDLPLLHNIAWLTLLIPSDERTADRDRNNQTTLNTSTNRLDTKSLQRMKSSNSTSASIDLQSQIKDIQYLQQLRQLANYLQLLDERLQRKKNLLTQLLTTYREFNQEKTLFEKRIETYLEEIVQTVDSAELSRRSRPPSSWKEYLRIYLSMSHRRQTNHGMTSTGTSSGRIRNMIEDVMASYWDRNEQIKSQLKGLEKQMLEELKMKMPSSQETVSPPLSLPLPSLHLPPDTHQVLQQVILIRQACAAYRKGQEKSKEIDGSLIGGGGPRSDVELEQCLQEIDRMEGHLVKANEDALLVIEKVHRMLKEQEQDQLQGISRR
jgi:hypothetical protein